MPAKETFRNLHTEIYSLACSHIFNVENKLNITHLRETIAEAALSFRFMNLK